MESRSVFVRNLDAWSYLEAFVVSAVAAILAIRLFLVITSYPQLGSATLHIAHMLWGGLLMLAAIMMLLTFLTRAAHRLAAVVGGFGFGTFIDEVGKFVTRDHDYFFQPAVALMYISFVLTILAVHVVHTRRDYSAQEYLLNALREMEEIAVHDLSEAERLRALLYLEQSDPANPLVPALRALLDTAAPPPRKPHIFSRAREALRVFYLRVARLPGFPGALIMFFAAKFFISLAQAIVLVLWWGFGLESVFDYRVLQTVAGRLGTLGMADAAHLGSSLLAGGFTLAGILQIRRSRSKAFEMFERSILVSILLTQVFTFYRDQFAGLIGLAVNIAILVGVRFVIGQERLSSVRA